MLGALLCGAAAGAGVFLIGHALVPRPSVELDRMLERIERSAAPGRPHGGGALGMQALPERVGARMLTSIGRLGVPRADLAVLGRTAEAHMGTKCLAAVTGAVLPSVFMALAALMGMQVPLQVPLVLSAAVAAGMWANTDIDVRGKARRARVEWRHAVASYLERVRLARAAGAGPDSAMESQAEIGDSLADERIRGALRQARVLAQPPWMALHALGKEVGVPELELPASAMSRAANGGAPVMEVLATQADALEDRLTADRQAAANEASETLRLPGTAIFCLVLFLMLYPGMQALASFS
jgi:tight adherence protein C